MESSFGMWQQLFFKMSFAYKYIKIFLKKFIFNISILKQFKTPKTIILEQNK
jgi:hypothetical protein